MANTRTVIVDGSEYQVSPNLSQSEIKRQLAGLLGAPWIQNAQVCEDSPGGTLRLNRPPAAPKGV
jgi:hypothetical protein